MIYWTRFESEGVRRREKQASDPRDRRRERHQVPRSLGLYGIVVVALITSIIVNFYNEVKDSEGKTKPLPEAADADDNTENEEEK